MPLLLHVARLVEEGRLHWDQRLTLADRHKSRGSGVLKDLAAGLDLTLHDVCFLMVVLSDNTATDLLIEWVGLQAVNHRLEHLGFRHTRLQAQKSGEEGVGQRAPWAVGFTTPAEMVALLLGVLQHTLVTPTSAQVILNLLGAQQDRSMIPRFLPPDWRYAGKTGSNEDLRADVGIVTPRQGQPIILALYCQHPAHHDWSVDSPDTLTVARLAQHLLASA